VTVCPVEVASDVDGDTVSGCAVTHGCSDREFDKTCDVARRNLACCLPGLGADEHLSARVGGTTGVLAGDWRGGGGGACFIEVAFGAAVERSVPIPSVTIRPADTDPHA
jgi:hypothetical protein